MEKGKSSSLVIGLLILIIVILLGMCVLLITGKISFNTDKENNENETPIIENNDEYAIYKQDGIDIKILSIDKAEVDPNGINTKLFVSGKMELSLDENKYIGLGISGFCLGKDNKKYAIAGPTVGAALFHDGDTNLWLTEVINDEWKWDKEAWKDVEIKTCELEKIYVVEINSDDTTKDRYIPFYFRKDFE